MNKCLLVLLGIFVVLATLTANNQVECARRDRTDTQDYQSDSVEDEDNKRFKLVYKILRAYLLKELDDLDQLNRQSDDSRSSVLDRRQLKSQGLLERLKNKMDHDLNKYGWD